MNVAQTQVNFVFTGSWQIFNSQALRYSIWTNSYKKILHCVVLLYVEIFKNIIRTLNGNLCVSAYLPWCFILFVINCKGAIYWQLYNYLETVVRLK
jgi:hypothetical protein